MSNPTPEELETQRLEDLQIQEEIREMKENVILGKKLAKLRAMPEFKEVFDLLFYDKGRRFLWENINHAEEELLMNRRPTAELERGKKLIAGLKRQVDGRLVFKSFLDTIEFDHDNAVQALAEDEEGEE